MNFWKMLLGSAGSRKGTRTTGDFWDERTALLITTLREAVGKDDWFNRRGEVSSLIIAERPPITRALASLALEFNPDHQERDLDKNRLTINLSAEAVCLIEKIGRIEDDSARSLFTRFIRGRDLRKLMEEPNATSWVGLYRQVGQTLARLGYLKPGGA
jgi:hypothetical protein